MRPYIAYHTLKERSQDVYMITHHENNIVYGFHIPSGKPISLEFHDILFHRHIGRNETIIVGREGQFWNHENSKLDHAPLREGKALLNTTVHRVVSQGDIPQEEIALFLHYYNQEPPKGLNKDQYLCAALHTTPERLERLKKSALNLPGEEKP